MCVPKRRSQDDPTPRLPIPTQVLQAEKGYPAMTDEIRAKILGLNSARLYGVDPEAVRCTVAADSFAMARTEMRDAGPRPVSRPLGPRTRRDFLRLQALEDTIEKGRRGIA